MSRLRILLLTLVSLPFSGLHALSPPQVSARSAILVDARSGRVLFEKNADEQRPAASTQKLLTALVICDDGGLNKPVVIQASDTNVEPSKINIKSGDSYTRLELLRALLVKSGNDVAVALARDNAGNINRFAGKMNRKAWQLGAYNSKFLNPNGLPNPGQYSTARDLSRVAMACYRSAVIRSIIGIRHLPFRYADGRIVKLKNTNRVLHSYAYCNGMKTGYTNKAGHCLVSSASKDGFSVISVVLGDSKTNVWPDSHSLLEYGLAKMKATTPPADPAPSPISAEAGATPAPVVSSAPTPNSTQ